MIEWDVIEENIKKTNEPLLILKYFFLNKHIVNDDDMCIIIRYIMKYHFSLFIKKDIRKLLKFLDEYNLSKNVINDFYKNIIKQIELMNKIKKFYSAYKKKNILNKTIKDQLKILNILKDDFYSVNDCSIGTLHFHKKLKLFKNDSNSIITNSNEIFNRLKIIYKMFGLSFFTEYNINIISYNDYYYFSYDKRCNYIEYIFYKINNIISENINALMLYDCLKLQLNNLVNPIPITIEYDIFTSELDDFDF